MKGNHDDKNSILTKEEAEVLDKLTDAWNIFIRLPTYYERDSQAFGALIDSAKNIVLCRAGYASLHSNLWEDRQDG